MNTINRLLIPICLVALAPLALAEDAKTQRVRIQVATKGDALDRDFVGDLFRPIYLRHGEKIELEGNHARTLIRISVVASGKDKLEVRAVMVDREVHYSPRTGKIVKVLKTHPAQTSSILLGKAAPKPIALGNTTVRDGKNKAYQLHVGWPAIGEHPILKYASWSFACQYVPTFRVFRGQKTYDTLLGTMRTRMRGYTPGRHIPPIALGKDRMALLVARGSMDGAGKAPAEDKSTWMAKYLRGKLHIKKVLIKPDRLLVVAKLANTPSSSLSDHTAPLDAVIVPRLKLRVEFSVNGIIVFREDKGLDAAAWKKAVAAGMSKPAK